MDCNSAQSDALPPPPYALSTMLESPQQAQARREGNTFYFQSLLHFTMCFKVGCLFAVYHYVLEKECEFVLLFLSKSFFVSFPFSFPSQQGCYFQNTALCPNAIQLCKNMGQHIPRMKTQN